MLTLPMEQQRQGDNHVNECYRSVARDHSSLNVRILTRRPLAKLDFDLYRSFGERLVFGMSLPGCWSSGAIRVARMVRRVASNGGTQSHRDENSESRALIRATRV